MQYFFARDVSCIIKGKKYQFGHGWCDKDGWYFCFHFVLFCKNYTKFLGKCCIIVLDEIINELCMRPWIGKCANWLIAMFVCLFVYLVSVWRWHTFGSWLMSYVAINRKMCTLICQCVWAHNWVLMGPSSNTMLKQA